MHALVEPLDHSVFHFADALQICEVLLEFVPIGRHALQSIVVSDILLIRQLLEVARLPLDAVAVEHAHERHDRDRDLDKVLRADRGHRDRVGAEVGGRVELSLLLVDPLPARLPRCETVELVLRVLLASFGSALVAITLAAKEDGLARAERFNAELEHLVNSGALLITKGDLAFPQPGRPILEILAVLSLKSLNCRLHQLLEFKNYVSAEPFA